MESFVERLQKLNKENVYPLHMPGHKRRMELTNPYSIDITEIDGYDNLHAPEGMIKELEERVSSLYDEKGEFIGKSYVLVNGSTCGILAAISSVTKYADRILMARNSHKSAYNALCIRGLDADYLYPESIDDMQMNAAISPEQVVRMLKENKGKSYSAVYVTSPTYEGIVSNIRALADIAHEYNIPLIVDEAHGAHFGLAEGFPDTAIKNGADIVIQSIHKTLMGMTQTAILHVSEAAIDEKRVDVEKLEYFLRVYQSSSPSYVLMASVDECVGMLEKNKDILFEEYSRRLEDIRKSSEKWRDIHFFAPRQDDNVDKDKIYDYDCGKLVIYSESGILSGRQIYDILRNEYAMQPEMSLGRYCLAMTSCMDSAEGFERLANALEEIDRKVCAELYCNKVCESESKAYGQRRMERKYTIAEAFDMKKSMAKLSAGMISGDYGYVYPPGIPFIVPGEVVTKEIICDIINAHMSGYEVHGVVFEGDVPYMNVTDV